MGGLLAKISYFVLQPELINGTSGSLGHQSENKAI